MGSLLAKLFWMASSDKQYKILVLGLNNAGKTTVLYSLLHGKAVATQPTLGCNVEEFKFRNFNFYACDCGGQEILRHSWVLYYQSCDSVIVVVDSADPGRFDTIRAEIEKMVQHPDLKDASFLIFANKQDLANSVKPADVAVRLELPRLLARHTWTIQGSSCVTQEGLTDGLGWIADHLSK